MPFRLSVNTIETIKADPILYGLVAEALRIRPTSLLGTLNRNTSRHLTKGDVLKVLSEYTGKEADELIEDFADKSEFVKQVTNKA